MRHKRGLTVFLLIWFMSVSFTVRSAEAQAIPKEAKIHNQLGNDYCDKGEFEKGVEEYEKAIKLYPKYTDALYNAGMTCYLDLKDYAKAISYFRQFMQGEGDSADAKQVKKWLAEAGQKLAAQKNAQPKDQEVQGAQGKESAQKEISPSVKPAQPPQVAGQTGQTPQDTAQAASSSRQDGQIMPSSQQAGAPPSPQEAVQSVVPPAEETAPVEQPSISEGVNPVGVGLVPPSRNASFEPQEQQATPPSREDQSRIYKDRGNDYNNQGKPDEAVKEYMKSLQIHPEYTDALYNIAKTYDFSLRDYANAIRYYKQFLQHESPSSRDAAQVKIWLGRAEESLQAQNKPVQDLPKVGQPSIPAQAQQKTQIASASPAAAKPSGAKAPTSGAKVLTRGKKEGDFFIKEFLSPTPVKAGSFEMRGEAEAGSKEMAQEAAAPQPVANTQPPKQEVAVASLPASSASESPAQAQTRSSGGREIIIETIFPKDLRAADLIPMVMSRMQKEMTEVFAQAKAESPEKLAELYLSKIQSDILPSGERVSSFRLGGKELADLPYIRILTEEEKKELEKEKWDLIRTRKSPSRLKEVLTLLRDGYKVVPR